MCRVCSPASGHIAGTHSAAVERAYALNHFQHKINTHLCTTHIFAVVVDVVGVFRVGHISYVNMGQSLCVQAECPSGREHVTSNVPVGIFGTHIFNSLQFSIPFVTRSCRHPPHIHGNRLATSASDPQNVPQRQTHDVLLMLLMLLVPPVLAAGPIACTHLCMINRRIGKIRANKSISQACARPLAGRRGVGCLVAGGFPTISERVIYRISS